MGPPPLFIFFRSFLGFKLGFWSILIGQRSSGQLPLLAPDRCSSLTTRFDHRLVEGPPPISARRKWQIFWGHRVFRSSDPRSSGPASSASSSRSTKMLRSIFLRGTRDHDADLELDHGLVAAIAGCRSSSRWQRFVLAVVLPAPRRSVLAPLRERWIARSRVGNGALRVAHAFRDARHGDAWARPAGPLPTLRITR